MALVPAILSPKQFEAYYLAPLGAVRLSECTALPVNTVPEDIGGFDNNLQLGRAVESEVWTVSGDGLPQPQPFKQPANRGMMQVSDNQKSPAK